MIRPDFDPFLTSVFLPINDDAPRSDKDKVHKVSRLLEAARCELVGAHAHLAHAKQREDQMHAYLFADAPELPRSEGAARRKAAAENAEVDRHLIDWAYEGYAHALFVLTEYVKQLDFAVRDSYLSPHIDVDRFAEAGREIKSSLKDVREMRHILVHRENNLLPSGKQRRQAKFQSPGLISQTGTGKGISVRSAITLGVKIEATGKDQVKVTLEISDEFLARLRAAFSDVRGSFFTIEFGAYYRNRPPYA